MLYRQIERIKYDNKYFENEYWKEDLNGKIGNKGISYEDDNHYKRFTFIGKLLQKYLSFDSFLDAGCGTALLTNILAKQGIQAFGFDFSKSAFINIEENFNSHLVLGGIEAIPFSNECVDVVFCSDVLEHVPIFDIEIAVSELTRVARHFVIATINMDNPYIYHPTILSRNSWHALFLLTGVVQHDKFIEDKIQQECQKQYPEYEFFIYRKVKM